MFVLFTTFVTNVCVLPRTGIHNLELISQYIIPLNQKPVNASNNCANVGF